MALSAGWCVLTSECRPPFAFDLGTVHQTARIAIEWIATVHGAAVVPQNEIADLPDIVPGQLVASRAGPDLIEQGLRFRKRQTIDVGISAAAEVEAPAAGFGMRADERV